MKPQYVAPILLVLAVRRNWDCLIGFACSTVVLFAVPVLTLGTGVDVAYVHILRVAAGWHGQFGYSASLNQSVSGFLRLLVPPRVAFPLTAVIALLAAGALLHVARRRTSLDLPYGLAVLIGVGLSPHVLVHDLTLLLLPVAIAVRYRQRGPWHLAPLLVAGSAAIIAGAGLSSLIPIQLSVLAMLALGIWLYRAKPDHEAATNRLEQAPVPNRPSPVITRS